MNFLAHTWLSFSDDELVGNMLADYIRNRERHLFSEGIQKGIALHRAIDTFTDSHPEVSEAKKVFQPLVRLYSGAFADVAFDYFLARSVDGSTLMKHSKKVYATVRRYTDLLPENFLQMFCAMEKDNWLYNYRYDRGIEFSMKNVLNKARYLDKSIPVFQAFLANREVLQYHFDRFFPELEAQALAVHRKLVSD